MSMNSIRLYSIPAVLWPDFSGSRLPHLPQDLVVLVMVTGVHLARSQPGRNQRNVYPWEVRGTRGTNVRLFLLGKLPPTSDTSTVKVLCKGKSNPWLTEWSILCTSHMMKRLDAKYQESTSKMRLQPSIFAEFSHASCSFHCDKSTPSTVHVGCTKSCPSLALHRTSNGWSIDAVSIRPLFGSWLAAI